MSLSIGLSESILPRRYVLLRDTIRIVRKQQIVFGERYPSNLPPQGRHGNGPFLKNLIVPNVEVNTDETKALMKRMYSVEVLLPLQIIFSAINVAKLLYVPTLER